MAALLDGTDSNLAFIQSRETVHPMNIFRLREGEFLICYQGKIHVI